MTTVNITLAAVKQHSQGLQQQSKADHSTGVGGSTGAARSVC